MRRSIRKKRPNHLPVHNVAPREISEKPKRMLRSLKNLKSQPKLSRAKSRRMNQRKRNLKSQQNAKRLNQKNKMMASPLERLQR